MDPNVFKDEAKSNLYINSDLRNSFSNLEDSIQHFLKQIDLNNLNVLDAGCAAGKMANALKELYPNIHYTGIDPDQKCIEYAKENISWAYFASKDFFEHGYERESFDAVMLWNWAYMTVEWKKLFKTAIDLSSKYIFFDLRVRLSGNTVLDTDCSFQYYHSSGKMIPYIVHNIYELLAFFHLDYLNLKKVSVYGYPFPGKTSAFLPLPVSEAYVAGFCLEKYSAEERENVIRMGTKKEATENSFLTIDVNIPGFR